MNDRLKMTTSLLGTARNLLHGPLAAMVRSAPLFRRRVGVVLLMGAVVAGCASGKGKVSVAGTQITRVTHVLEDIRGGVAAGDADVLAALWQDADHDAARSRIAAGLSGSRVNDLHLALVGVRVEGDQSVAQVGWIGQLDGEPASGRFRLSLTTGETLRIISVAGELPWAPGGRGAALSSGLEVPTGR